MASFFESVDDGVTEEGGLVELAAVGRVVETGESICDLKGFDADEYRDVCGLC